MGADVIFLIAILVVSVVIHEVSHGFAANWLGDPTAKLAGRLTLNPVSHIDPMGSIVLPAILVLSGSPFLFGWAKP
ncbi:MAG: site-2 protease family protein, partial [Candidatus Pacebacteria bacterium]|nr:site-2 protease family protein [Candidatus Paceibacterota bacterium]